MAQQIKKKFIGADQIDGSKIKLLKDQAVRGQKQDGSEVELLKLDSSDKLVSQGQEIAFKSQVDQEILDRIQGDLDALQDAKDYADQKVSDLVNSAPEVLDTLKELADALGGDANFAATVAGQIGALDDKIDEEIQDRIDGDAATLSSAQSYADSLIAAIPPVDLTNYYTKPEVEAFDNALSARITALEQYDQEAVFVDSVNGVDEIGRGTMLRPFRTINYAYSQVQSLGNPTNTVYNANVGKFITEKLVIRLAPGTYTENVVLGFKRARVALVGNGVTIVGDVRMEARLSDFPASSLRGATMAASFPAPWTGWTSGVQQCFEIAGEAGGALESDASSQVIQVTGLTSIVYAEPSLAGSGVGDTWDSRFGTFFSYVKSANLNRGIVFATQHSAATPSVTECNFEIDSARIGTDMSLRNFFGAVPHSYIANYATWNSTNFGTTNKAPTGVVNVKMHNSTMASVLGPRLTIGEMDGCRIYDIDRTMSGTVDNGAISGSPSSSLGGIVNCQFRTSTGTNALQLGAASGSTRLKIDSVSYTTLAFSRNSSGVLSARTLTLGGTSFDFLDDARSIFVNDPATNYTRSASTVDSALEGIDAALGLKANQSSITSIESSISSLQSADSSLQSQINTEKGRINAILSASEADKDSFAEIVALINSVDTANDSAFAGYVLSNDAAVAALDSRIDALEAQTDGPSFSNGSVVVGSELSFIDLDRQYIKLMSVAVGRMAIHEGQDYTVSIVGGVTRLTWIGSLVNPSGSEAIETGDKVFFVGAY